MIPAFPAVTRAKLPRASVKRPPERTATEVFFYSKRQGGTNRLMMTLLARDAPNQRLQRGRCFYSLG